jgi:hypothetical protein
MREFTVLLHEFTVLLREFTAALRVQSTGLIDMVRPARDNAPLAAVRGRDERPKWRSID